MVEVFKTTNEFGTGEVRSWASLLDYNCRLQAEAISRVPIMDEYLALMPDAHFGFGPPVGSALITRNAVMPYAIGVDIGCGMIAVKTTLDRENFRGHENQVLGKIREYIPSGVGRQRLTQSELSKQFFTEFGPPPGAHLGRPDLIEMAKVQFGTLGSGNHFVEVCTNADNEVWLLLHSGSRGVGNQLATAHVKIAQGMCKTKLESKEFAYFERGTDEFDAYIADMMWCQDYARGQREAMMDALAQAVLDKVSEFETEGFIINCHHNYAEFLDDERLLTRKGAIDASAGVWGIIPGSMGASTYIVRGKGNAEAYNTSPHGAGRLLGRGEAKRTLDIEEFKASMAGRTWMDRDAQALLDEAPLAYKPIDTVIADSVDLIEPVAALSQFINYKGL